MDKETKAELIKRKNELEEIVRKMGIDPKIAKGPVMPSSEKDDPLGELHFIYMCLNE